MRRRLLLLGVVLAAAAVAAVLLHDGSGFRAPRDVAAAARRLDAAVPAALAAGHVPGAAVAVVRDGRLAWARGYGVADARTRRPMTATTRLQAGSLSKAVTAWGVVASGTPPLEAPVRPWPLAGTGTGVTARRLLSHTAGLSVGGYLGVPPGRPLGTTTASLLGRGGEGRGSAVRVLGAPGRRVRYSGGGYTVLQAAIEARTGTAFAAWARRTVLAPLRMRDSAFAWPPPGGAAVATGHDVHGRPVPGYRYPELAAAGLASTAADLGRFAAAVQREPGRLGTAQPATDGRYGLGLDVGRLGDGTRVLWHEGVNRGWHARLVVWPGRGWGAVVLTNGDGGGRVADAVQGAFER